ncbi:hypothetical protein JW968_01230 [Candidatus Woesearchaeota archaeon]|nr:hypothetical protein [Candidatus Woesearchaeota archaeon]
MVTTIKIHEDTKASLDRLRRERESYDDLIKRVISMMRRENLEKELKEAYLRMGKKELEMLEEWENASL